MMLASEVNHEDIHVAKSCLEELIYTYLTPQSICNVKIKRNYFSACKEDLISPFNETCSETLYTGLISEHKGISPVVEVMQDPSPLHKNSTWEIASKQGNIYSLNCCIMLA